MPRITTTAALGLALLLAIYVGLRLPNLWSLNYYIPGAFDGFWRRGLLGTLLHPLGAIRFNYWFIAGLQALVLLAFVGLLARQALLEGLRATTIAALFFVGPAGAYLFHEIGYVDQLLYLLLLVALLVRDKRIGLALMLAALFVHEIAALTVIPVWLAHLVVTNRLRAAWGQGALLVAAFALIYFFLQVASVADIERLLQKIAAAANYPPRTDYYTLYLAELTGSRQQYYFRGSSLNDIWFALVLAAFTGAAFARRSVLKAASVAVACSAPLLLGWFGWDTDRWIFLSFLSATVVLVFFRETVDSPSFFVVALVLAIYVPAGYLDYFDGYKPRTFSDLSHVPQQFSVIPTR